MAWKLHLHLANICLFVMFLNTQYGLQTSFAKSTGSSQFPQSLEDESNDEEHFTISHCLNFEASPLVDCRSLELDEFPTWKGDKIKNPSIPTVEFKLHFNKISKVVQIRNSSEIIKIDFFRNIISEIEPFAFVNLSILKTLIFSHNRIVTIHPNAFRSKTGSPLCLENLNLSHNSISALPENAFDDLTKLKHLSLFGNKIAQLPTSFNKLASLKYLNVSRNEFSDLPTTLMKMVARLHSLDLSRNSFNRVPEVLRYGKNIGTLIFSENNRTSELDNKSFLGLGNVKLLEINKMGNLMVIYRGTFTPLNSLEILNCNMNPKLYRLEESSFRNTFGGHASLKKVDFSNNNFSFINADVFKNMTMCEIDLQGNPLKCDCDIKLLIRDNIRTENKCRFYSENGEQESYQEMNITDIETFCDLEESASSDLLSATISILITFLMFCVIVVLARFFCQRKSSTEKIIPTQLQITRQYTMDNTTEENFDEQVCTKYARS